MLSVEFTADEIRELQEGRFHYPEPRVQRKYEVLWLKHCGLPHQEIARLAGVTSRTVQRIVNEFLEGRLERVQQNHYLGQPSKLNAHAESLKASFEKQPPATIAEARHRIEELTGILRGESQVRAFLKRLGMRRLKLGGVPGKIDEAKQREQREFLENRLNPALDAAERGEGKFFCRRRPLCAWCVFELRVVLREDVRPHSLRSKTLERFGRARLCHQRIDATRNRRRLATPVTSIPKPFASCSASCARNI